jgi:hypothetical protein
MRMSRDTVRVVAPPFLALGLVALLTHPLDIPTTGEPPATAVPPAAVVVVDR